MIVEFLGEMADLFSLFVWFLAALALTEFIIVSDTNGLFLAIILTITNVSGAMISYSFSKDVNQLIQVLRETIPNLALVRRLKSTGNEDTLEEILPNWDSTINTIKAEDIVLGDIVVLNEGGLAPCDLRVIESNGLKVDNSKFTGESDLVCRIADVCHCENPLEANNILFAGSYIK